MSHAELAKTIDAAFEARNDVGPSTKGAVREAVETALDLLDRGEERVAERQADGAWRVEAEQEIRPVHGLPFRPVCGQCRFRRLSACPGESLPRT